MKERKSRIAKQIIADYNKEKEYKDWLERKKQSKEKEGKMDGNNREKY